MTSILSAKERLGHAIGFVFVHGLASNVFGYPWAQIQLFRVGPDTPWRCFPFSGGDAI